jgi:O-antigen ligase
VIQRKAPDGVRIIATRAQIHTRIVLQVVCCAAPAMLLVGLEQFTAGAYYLFAVLGLLVVYHLFARQTLEATAIALGVIPVMMLLRGLFLYNSPQILFACCALALLGSKKEKDRFFGNLPLVCFVCGCTLYWLISVLLTGDYSSNIRMIEFCLTASLVFLLSAHRSYLASALCGVALSAIALAIGLLPFGSRVGIVSVSSDLSLGNPITLGLSATVGFLLTVADGGSWMLLDRRTTWRLVLNLAAGLALLISTSRGSWLVTIVGLIITGLANNKARKALLACLLVFAAAVGVLLQTERGPAIQHYFDNAMSDDRSLDQRTTGRADQWQNFPRVFDASPLWGFGPGSGKAVSLHYTKLGKVWHSLYLHIGAETGLLGLGALATLLMVVVVQGWKHWKERREIVPFMCVLCFMFIGVSVSAVDAISGVFLGLAFVGGHRAGPQAVRILTAWTPKEETVGATAS